MRSPSQSVPHLFPLDGCLVVRLPEEELLHLALDQGQQGGGQHHGGHQLGQQHACCGHPCAGVRPSQGGEQDVAMAHPPHGDPLTLRCSCFHFSIFIIILRLMTFDLKLRMALMYRKTVISYFTDFVLYGANMKAKSNSKLQFVSSTSRSEAKV